MGVNHMKKLKRRGHSVQELIGIRSFTKYGLNTEWGELLFYQVTPTNISVLSHANVEQKIHHLIMVLSALPELEVVCADSYDSFEDNKRFLTRRLDEEQNPKVRALLEADIEMLDRAQAELSAARQFLFIARCRGMKEEQVLQQANRVEKTISEQGFEVHRLSKPELKRFLAIWFRAGTTGDQMPDVDGAQYFDKEEMGKCFI